MEDKLKTQLRTFLSKYIKLDNLGDDDNFFKKGLINSLFVMQLINLIENEFEISIDDSDLKIDNFKSIGAITGFVKLKKSLQYN